MILKWCSLIPSIKFVFIFRIGNPDLLWQYADLVLDSNEEDGVELFLQGAYDPKKGLYPMDLDPNTVANYLQRYPKSLILYLEHLINDRGNEVCTTPLGKALLFWICATLCF